MSKEIKVVLIGCGALVAIVIAFGVIGILALPKLMRNVIAGSEDPKHVAAVNATIADFKVPPGYYEVTAVNMFVTSLAIMAPKYPREFTLELQGMPTATNPAVSGQTTGRLDFGMKMGLGSRCSSFDDRGSETIAVRGTPEQFRIYDCRNREGEMMRAEIGNFTSRTSFVTVLAFGATSAFDEKALRTLLASVR